MMVQIHNFLNERAWQEVLRWEKRQNLCVSLLLLFIGTADVAETWLLREAMKSPSWRGFREGQANSLPKHGSGYLPVGSFLTGSSCVPTSVSTAYD